MPNNYLLHTLLTLYWNAFISCWFLSQLSFGDFVAGNNCTSIHRSITVYSSCRLCKVFINCLHQSFLPLLSHFCPVKMTLLYGRLSPRYLQWSRILLQPPELLIVIVNCWFLSTSFAHLEKFGSDIAALSSRVNVTLAFCLAILHTYTLGSATFASLHASNVILERFPYFHF